MCLKDFVERRERENMARYIKEKAKKLRTKRGEKKWISGVESAKK
jgi:hypothetical protein